jgi:hypothetical protein
VKVAFQKAAISCFGVGARPLDWVEAQFVKFEEYRQWFGKLIFPQPQQLHGLNAQARYVQWFAEQRKEKHREERKQRPVVKGFKIEERNLRQLCKTMRLPEIDVLCEKPEQFSIEFLRHKAVYKVVKKKRLELTGDA